MLCESLKSINIPYGVTRIEDGTFDSCISLETVHIASTVIEIDKNAFDGCEKMKTIIYDGTESQWAKVNNRSKAVKKASIVFNK